MQKIVCILGLLLPVLGAYSNPLSDVSVSADFTFTNNACSGTAVQFTATVSSGTPDFTYSWDFGDGGIANAQTPQHTFTSLGCATANFTVSLKVKDALNDSIIIRKAVTIKQSPNITLQDLTNPFNPFSNCSNSPTNANPRFTIRPGLGTPVDASCISSISVDWGDGSAVLSGLNPASFPLAPHVYNNLGIYTLVVTAQGNNGCSTIKTYPVVNQANPAVGISAPGSTSGCAPSGFWFKVSRYELNSPGTIYVWDFGDRSPTVTWTTPIQVDSIYHVFNTTSCGQPSNQFTVKVTAKNGCDSTAATINNIRIFQKPVANFNLPASGSACVSTAVTFTSISTAAYNQGDCNRNTNYTWSSDDGGALSGSSSYTHSFTTSGNHTVTLVAAGSCGNDTITKIIAITAPPATPVAGSNGPICAGSTLNLTASTVAGATSYAWTGPGGYINPSQNPIRTNATTAMSGTYSVTAALANGCTSAPSTVSVVVNATPATPTGTTAYSYCLNATVPPLTATGATGNTLNWYTVATGGTPVTTAPTPVTTATGATTYYVSQVNPATPACESGRLAITVTVRAAPVITASYTDPASCTVSNGSITLSGLSASTSYTVQYTRNSTTPPSVPLTSNAAGNIIITALTSGTYTNITVTIGGCASNAVGPFTLVSPSAPAAPVAGSNSPVCSGGTLNLTATGAAGTYAWTGPGGYTSPSQNSTRTNATTAMSGAYSVTLTVNGCTSAPATINVLVAQTPATPVVVTPVDYCQNAAAAPLTATALPGHALNWYTTATGGTAGAATPTPSTAAAGSFNFYVSQVISSPPGCEGQRSFITVNVKPVPVISGNAANPAGCASSNGSITLTGLTAGTSYLVQYTLNGGMPVQATLTAGTTGAVTILNLSAGTYTNVTAALNGCSSNAVGPFTLTSFSTPATPVAGSNSPVCAGSSLNLTAGAAPAGATYAWTGPGGYTSTSQNPVRTGTTTDMSGTYSVTVSLNGCTSAPASVNVAVGASGTVTVGSNSPLCAGSTITLLAGTNSTGAFRWTWSGPNNFSSNQQNPSIQNATAAAGGTYTVTASSVTGSCPSSATTNVLITAQPFISAAGASSPAACSAGSGSIALQGLAPNTAYAVQYSKNGIPQAAVALVANAGGGLAIPNLSGGVYSAITVSQGGCVSNTVGPFTLTDINTLTGAPRATSNSPLCTGNTLQLGASTTATGTLAYQWTGPNGFSSAAQNPSIGNITPAAAGKYYVSVSAGSCVSAKDSVDVQIGSYPVVNLGPDLVLAPGSQRTLTASVQNGPISQYLWTPAANLSCTACASPVVTAQATASYILTVTNNAGCSASDTINIKTLCEGSNVFIPDAFTPDGDGLNDRFVIRASGPVRVKYFRVFNKWGEMVFEKMNFLPNDPAYGWDGKVKGMAVPPDVFVYTALVTCEGSTSFPYKGNVTILK